jgi:hypothetical protein
MKSKESRYILTAFSNPAVYTDSIPTTRCRNGIKLHNLKNIPSGTELRNDLIYEIKQGTRANAHTCSISTKCSISLELVLDERNAKRKKHDSSAIKRFSFLKYKSLGAKTK